MTKKNSVLELTAKNHWVSEDQKFIENVYMLRTFAGHYGKDDRYWGHHKNHLEIINQLELTDNLVLPYIYMVNGLRTVVLLEFELEKSFDYSPIKITKWEDEIVATLEKKEL